jgi:hypothetical protein
MARVLDRSPSGSTKTHAANIHDDAIAEIVSATHAETTHVERIYHAELSRLKASARVTDYLVLFAVRRTRELLARGRDGRAH